MAEKDPKHKLDKILISPELKETKTKSDVFYEDVLNLILTLDSMNNFNFIGNFEVWWEELQSNEHLELLNVFATICNSADKYKNMVLINQEEFSEQFSDVVEKMKDNVNSYPEIKTFVRNIFED